jgi:subtilisin family serine protease
MVRTRRIPGGVRVLLALAVLVAGMLPALAARNHRSAMSDPQVRTASAKPRYTRNTLLVGLRDARIQQVLNGLSHATQRQVRVLDHLNELGVVRLRVPDDRVDAILERLRTSGSTRFVEREGKAQAASTPNDPYYPWSGSNVIYGGQWGDELTQAPRAWDITTGRSSVVVAVVDSGIDDTHPDLAGKLVAGTSVIGGSTTATVPHGEYVAGVIAPNTNNATGVAGYCWACN